MRGVWLSVVVGAPVVWAVSSRHSTAGLVLAMVAMGLGAAALVRASLRVEGLETELEALRSRQGVLEREAIDRDDERARVQRALVEACSNGESWRQRAHELQTALDEARSSRASFLATVSHELRTPLHAVIGFTELVSDGSAGDVNEQQREYLGDARAAAQHLLRLISDVLDYAKSDAGRLTFVAETVEVGPIIDEIAALLEGLAAKKGLTLVTSCESGLTLLGDALRVRQVLLNLAGNAIKFTPRHGRVELVASANAGVCELVVRDTGLGIAREEHARVFEAFHQADSSTARAHAGTGLGLALVKRWTEMMGGAVELESAPGAGACFTVSLPRQAKLSALRRHEVRSGPDVLVAEDDDATRMMLVRVLEAQGCQVRPASNGQRALEQIMAQVPAVLVLDLMMPELDGFGLLEKLRSLPSGNAVPVLVFSASNPQGADRERLVALGAEVLLKGSLTPSELAQRIRSIAAPFRSAA